MAPLNDMFHINPIIEELQRIANTELKSALGLKTASIGDITTLPSPGISNVIPGIWIQPMPATINEFDDMPTVMSQKYFFRFVYVRMIGRGESIVQKSMDDATLIMNTYMDKYQFPDITNLPAGTQILWAIIKAIEWRPPEDMYIQNIHADLTAIAFNMECEVKTRRAL
jgi:hypothetical protein